MWTARKGPIESDDPRAPLTDQPQGPAFPTERSNLGAGGPRKIRGGTRGQLSGGRWGRAGADAARLDLDQPRVLPSEAARPLRLPELILPLGIAAVVRFAIVAAFLGSQVQGDEASYLRLGWAWSEFGAYSGIWAPLYSMLSGAVHAVFGEGAADALRLMQIGLSVWTGFWIANIAQMFGGRRAALTAAWIFALYLPLAGFAALIFSETLFLAFFVPALYHLLCFAREGRIDAPWWRAPLAGVLVGLAALTRESTMLFLPPCMVWISVALRGHATEKRVGRARFRSWAHNGGPLALAPAAIFGLTASLVILPWTIRNAHAFDRFIPVAVSAKGSSFVGWNAHDVNYDIVDLGPTFMDAPGRLRKKIRGEAPAPWQQELVPNQVDQTRKNVSAGLEFARENPAYFVRSRIVEFVDLVSPLSFIVRSLRVTEPIGEPLDVPALRRIFALLSVMMVPFLALSAVWGWAGARDAGPLRTLAGTLALCTTAVALVSGLSRYRVPLVPMLIVLAALFLSGAREKPPVVRGAIASFVAVVLVLAWLPSIGPTRLALSAIW